MFLVNSVKEVIPLVKDKHGDVCDSDNYYCKLCNTETV